MHAILVPVICSTWCSRLPSKNTPLYMIDITPKEKSTSRDLLPVTPRSYSRGEARPASSKHTATIKFAHSEGDPRSATANTIWWCKLVHKRHTLPGGRTTRPTQRGMLKTPTCPKRMPFFFLDLQMKGVFHKSFENTMLIPANEKPEWLLQFPG